MQTNFSVAAQEANSARVNQSVSSVDVPLKRDTILILRIVFWCLVAALGLAHAWTELFSMNQDGVSYLDLSDAIMRGDWNNALNAHWSPLYPLLLGAGRWLLGSTSETDFAIAHLVNFAIYLGAFACFDLLLREVIRLRPSDDEQARTLPAWMFVVFGYALFIWATLEFIPLRLLAPDMLVAALFFLAVALTLRLNREAANLRLFILLGVVLALGYYTKAAMFPLAFVFLFINLFAARSIKQSAPRVALAAAVFLSLSLPLIVAVSVQKNRLTFSETSKLSYAWEVNDINLTYWQGEDSRYGTPAHPLRKLSENPPVYEYGSPIGGTYPLWYDPSYWYDGITPRFDFGAQVKAMTRNALKFYNMFFSGAQIILFVGLIVLLAVLLLDANRKISTLVKSLAAQWRLLLPALAGLAMYALIYTEPRYTGAFYIVLWLGLFASVRFVREVKRERLMRAAVLMVAAVLLAAAVIKTTPKAYAVAREVASGRATLTHPQRQTIEALRSFGVEPGSRIAAFHPGTVLGSQSRMVALARLAGVRIVAGFRPEDASAFWSANEETRANIMQALARTEARVVLVENPPRDVMSNGWQRIGNSNFYLFRLSK